MGLFNSICADLLCPAKNKATPNTYIQIKWQKQGYLGLSTYCLGDTLNNIEDEYNNSWIRADYICDICSTHTTGYRGEPFIKTKDQKRHHVFVKIENARICGILSEKEFQKKGIKSFVDYL